MEELQEIISNPHHTNVLLVSTIKAIGIFSKAIVTFRGEEELAGYMKSLVDLSELKLVKEFEDSENPLNDKQNFKNILKK